MVLPDKINWQKIASQQGKRNRHQKSRQKRKNPKDNRKWLKKDIHQLQPYINKEAPEGYKIIHNNRNSFLFKSENTSHKCPSMTLSSCNELQFVWSLCQYFSSQNIIYKRYILRKKNTNDDCRFYITIFYYRKNSID